MLMTNFVNTAWVLWNTQAKAYRKNDNMCHVIAKPDRIKLMLVENNLDVCVRVMASQQFHRLYLEILVSVKTDCG